ncbi:hypothetical protein EHQ27_13380 [Leptospira wolffii]|uniref:EcsC family protein n=1 Tax=Leptospira wolffii TaxID=409998 RepID=A0A2M9ZF32_9LEPT|nr:hypothetical protein [Leptospira wolffii]PJZ67025.1 hypothetical protein CH371_02805 [Leptospira wolffii]TGK61999.1 hypothetical protein EHQ32_03940 [Leptospira wolffii]TGK68600.1 hypothetical protein EHQ27_13380 [Leptospira wolffii]TGK74616.1 hypothetical protein EHQ35_09840 [Leptospira wolffii]TGL31808.1 hypothetical protein EHQ57_02835 [Leptospira wolffii]
MENYNSILSAVSDQVLDLLSGLHSYRSPYAKTIGEPSDFIHELTQKASLQTAGASALLSLPSGRLGAATLAPELVLILRIQGKLVKDIAALYGKEQQVTPELMAYCLFQERSSFFRNFLKEAGARILVRPVTWNLLRQLAFQIARSFHKGKKVEAPKRKLWIPILGSLLSGGLSYTDTKKIAYRTKDLFSKDIISVRSDEPWAEESA